MKRLVVIADTHGNTDGVRESLQAAGEVSTLVHLGDGVLDGSRVAEDLGMDFQGVRGNEDWGVNLPERLVVAWEGWKFVLIHGHQWDINPYQPKDVWEGHLGSLAKTARSCGAHGLFFGHTHRCHLEQGGDVLLANPGDQYIGSSRPLTFALVEANSSHLRVCIMERVERCRWSLKMEAHMDSPDHRRF